MAEKLKTPQQVKAEFARAGVSIGSWAKANGFKREQVYAILSGNTKAKYGTAHQIALALGLKDGVVGSPETFRPASALVVATGAR